MFNEEVPDNKYQKKINLNCVKVSENDVHQIAKNLGKTLLFLFSVNSELTCTL